MPCAFEVRNSATQHVLRVLLAIATTCASALAHPFGFDELSARARARAAQPYKPPAVTADERLRSLKYDGMRDIRFRPSRSIWRADGSAFELQLFHVGGWHAHPMSLYELVDGRERALTVTADAFDYGQAFKASPPAKVELAGFRVHYPLNRNDYKDEVIAFLGASYFRAVGAGQHYGLSSRGLAIDTAGGRAEEFPRFESFWLERPEPGAKTLTVYALLDGPRVTGAYRFVVQPGAQTVVDVQARLFLRAPVATLGIAPLTSMYLSGENQPRATDFRPEVHDSDGLQIASAEGEWIWRPVLNPDVPFTTSFTLKRLRGFGLMQRDRAFASYEDTEARYEKRPSVWVEPLGDWGPGRVELMQFNALNEFHDNVVAYWVPAQVPPPGQPMDLSWRLYWQGDAMQRPPGGSVVQSRRGHGPIPLKPGEMQYIVDFRGGALSGLDDEAPVKAELSASGAEVTETNVYRNAVADGWRMTVKFKRTDPKRAVELRAYLTLGSDTLTETWSYALPPEQ